MFWILATILVLTLLIGIVYPAAAIIFFKCLGLLCKKKATVKQIMQVIGY